MYLDLSCPLEMQSFELSHDDTGKVRAYLELNNLSSRRIESIDGEVHWIDGKTGKRISAPFIADQLRTESQSPFRIQLSSGDNPGTNEIEMTFDRLGFTDGGPEWLGLEIDRVRIQAPEIPPGMELNRLLGAVGRDAHNFPVCADGYWICVCGRPNATGDACCMRCRRDRDTVLNVFTRGKVLSGETPAIFAPAMEPEAPYFLSNEAQERETAEVVVDRLWQQYRTQRGMLVRRSVFLVLAVVLVAITVNVMGWLGEKREVAREMRPPVPIETEATIDDDDLNWEF